MTDEERRLLELLSARDAGCTVDLIKEQGFRIKAVFKLAKAGLATVHAGRVLAGGRGVQVSRRVRITDVGRRALAERSPRPGVQSD